MPAEAAVDPNASTQSSQAQSQQSQSSQSQAQSQSQTQATGQQQAQTSQRTAVDPNAAGAGTQQAADYWAKEWAGADGKLNHAAWDKAPDELKGLKEQFSRYATLDEALKGVAEREKLLGKKGLMEPLPANATDAQKKERLDLLRKVNGTPEKPDGYGFARPQDLPETLWSDDFAKSAAAIMHEEGVSPAAAKRLFELNLATTKGAIAQQQQQEKAWYDAQDKLARTVAEREGMPFDKTMEWAQAAGRRFGIAADNPVMKNASVLLALGRVGQLLTESDGLVRGDANDFQIAANITPENARKEATRIQTDKNHPLYSAYWNRDGKHSDDEVKQARDTQKRYSQLGSGSNRRR